MSAAREIAASIFEGASASAGGIAGSFGGDTATAVRISGGVAGVIAALIRDRGVEEVRDILTELALRTDKASISIAEINLDDSEISRRVFEMFAAEGEPPIPQE